MVVASFSSSPDSLETGTVPCPDTVPVDELATVTVNRFSTLRVGNPIEMTKRKVSEGDVSSDSSPNSLDGVDYTHKGWTTRAGNDWRNFTWAFGFGPSSSSTTSTMVGRRRGRRMAMRKGGAKPLGSGEEGDPMKELLDCVMWNDGESETDITGELTDEEDESDDEEFACIKRLTMAREQTIRVAVPKGFGGGQKKTEMEKDKGNKAPARLFSVSSLRFDSQLKIGSTAESSKKSSVFRLERTNTMEMAFQGMLDDNSDTTSSKEGAALIKTSSSSTIVAGDEENFWDDVEF